MKRIFILINFILAFASIHAQFQVNEYKKAQQELDRRGEIYFSFQLDNRSQLPFLSKKISLSNINGDTIFAYANRKEFNEFINYNIDYKILTAPSELLPVQMSDNPKEVLTWNYYPTYTAYESIMAQFATDHPDICKLLTVTTLASGRKILGLRISDNVNLQENEPEFLYTATIHGDETAGYILMLHLADYLLAGYGTDARITNMVNNFDIVICPLTNPDGTYKGGNHTVNGATRGNANNIDYNRNFPDPKGGPHPDGNPWQPETVAFMNFSGFNTFTMGANFHGGTEVVNYPWDTWSRLTADDAWWIFTSREYADTVHLHAPSNYFNQYNNGITNGYAWYEIEGGRQDYMNYFRNCRESTLEISDTKLLPENQLLAHWEYNYRSLLNYIEQVGYGLHGLVTDSLSGEPLKAKVFISGFDIDSSHVYSDPQVGDYHRLLKGGSYNVTFSAAGYFPKTFAVQVADFQTTLLDVQLYDGRLETNFKADTTTVAVDQQINFHDQSAGNPLTWNWTFEGATPSTSTEMNPIVTYSQPGMYPVKLVVTRTGAIDSLVRNDYIEVKPWYIMGDKTYSVCDASFFDTGGPNSQYTDNESSIITFIPSEVTEKLTAVFNFLDIEVGGTDCTNDKLMIFDGTSINDNLLGTICGSSLPERVTATNANGALTFQFISNQAVSGSGWDITLSCDSNVGVFERPEYAVKIYPNPVTQGILTIDSEQPVQRLIVRDVTGRALTYKEPFINKSAVECNWPTGIYILQIQINGNWINRKIQVMNK